ncbi:MAG: glycosyltransferase family 4 protein [Candidatus Brocadiaceae bacterium]|nr:glycosyltransferase family 4 protein [Candidatus Brocadiaceae bacterium]
MKVCLISSMYPPRISGPSTQTRHFALFLKELGVTPIVVTFGERDEVSYDEGIKVYYLHSHEEPVIGPFLQYINAFFRLWKIFGHEGPNVVHHQTGVDYLSVISGFLAKRMGIPSIIKYAGDLVWERLSPNSSNSLTYEEIFSSSLEARFLTLLERFTLNNFTIIWAISSFQKKSLTDIHNIPEEKIVSLPNSICLDGIKTRESIKDNTNNNNSFEILTVCRFAKWKRIDNAILALSKLENNNIKLRIIGGENSVLEQELRNLAKSLGLSQRVIFSGSISPTEIGSHFSKSNIFLLPTAHEPCAIVLIEAMAAGLPIVTTNVGGNPDLVTDGQEGFLVEPGDVDGMARKLQFFIENPELRLRAGRLGTEKAERYSLKKNIHQFIDLYNGLVRGSL